MQKNKCKDCGADCNYRAIRCRACSDKRPKRIGPHSQITKDKISKSLMGNVPWNKGTAKIKKTRTQKELSEEIRLRMTGDKNPAKRPEVREKIRQSLLKAYINNPEILENRRASGINQHSDVYTSIESPIAEVLFLPSLTL